MTADKLVRDPVYKQLNDALRRLISSGEFPSGAKFLSEREIGERFSVSRATANKALSTLVAEGVLAFKKGVGTFVNEPGRRSERRHLSFDERAELAGLVPSTRVLVAARIGPGELDADVAAALALGEHEAVFYLERLRLADGDPVVFEQRYVAERLCPGLLALDLSRSLRAIISRRYGHEIAKLTHSLRAAAAGEKEAAQLHVETGAACLCVSSLAELASGVPLWWQRSLHRSDACELRAPLLECALIARRASRPARLLTG